MGVNVTSLFSKARKMDLHQSHKLVSAKRKWQASNGKAVVSKFFLAYLILLEKEFRDIIRSGRTAEKARSIRMDLINFYNFKLLMIELN